MTGVREALQALAKNHSVPDQVYNTIEQTVVDWARQIEENDLAVARNRDLLAANQRLSSEVEELRLEIRQLKSTNPKE